MPSSLVEFTRRPGYSNSDGTGDKVWWAGKYQSDGIVEAKSLDNSGEEVLETVGSKMHVCHTSKDPDHGIRGSLLKAVPCRSLTLVLDGVELHAVDCEIALLLSEPLSVVGEVGEEEETDDGNDEGNSTLKNEEPYNSNTISKALLGSSDGMKMRTFPARESGNIIETMEDTGGDQASECSGKNVSGVQNSDSSGNLLTSVEDREQVDGTRVVRRFCDTKEESGEQEAGEVLGHSGQGRHNSPEHHSNAHIPT